MFSPIITIESLIKTASLEHIDISRDYRSKISNRCYQIQSELIRQTRGLHFEYNLSSFHLAGETQACLDTLKKAKETLHQHPFRYVIDGRIASIVQSALSRKEKVPPEFMDDYAYFEFLPWNNPHLNYYSVNDLLRNHSFEAIPLEYRDR